jgi:hypothetical protein
MFPARYELNSYILFTRNSVFNGKAYDRSSDYAAVVAQDT